MNAPRFVRKHLRAAGLFVRSHARAALHGGDFRDLRAFCMFAGYPRSGHTLLSSILDAHPRIVMGHEQRIFKMAMDGYPRNALLSELELSARNFHQRGAGTDAGYSYAIDGQWQGRHQRLEVIGIQRGGRASRMLGRHPDLLPSLRRVLGVPLRIVHALRHPLDNIASMQRFFGGDLPSTIDLYFESCAGMAAAAASLEPGELLDLRHEDVVADPHDAVRRLCAFVGVDADPAYVEACARIVHRKPNLTRAKVPWTADHLASIRERASAYRFLDGYAIEAPDVDTA